MSTARTPFDPRTADEPALLASLIEEYRERIVQALDGLTEDQARRRLVPSRTTLLGLVKHVRFMETVWFQEVVSGTPRNRLGVGMTPDQSFVLRRDDTVASVSDDYRRTCEISRRVAAEHSLDDVVADQRGRPVTLRWIHLQVLRELAQHCGHADILREQVLVA